MLTHGYTSKNLSGTSVLIGAILEPGLILTEEISTNIIWIPKALFLTELLNDLALYKLKND